MGCLIQATFGYLQEPQLIKQNGGVLMRDKRSSYRQILLIFILLAVLSILEFAAAIYIDNPTVPLFVIALIKAGLIVQFFMHIYRLWRPEEHG